jgi:hypothetical protein
MVLVRWFEKSYLCPECATEWTDEWSCACNDRCPNCNLESSPDSVRDLSRKLRPQDFEGAARVLGLNLEGSVHDVRRIVTEEQARDFAEATLEGRSRSEIAACLLEHSQQAR